MFFHFLYPLHDIHGLGFLNVFRYLTFRSAYAAITALLVSFLVGPHLVHWLREVRYGQKIRAEGPTSHQGKAGTPTMGGLLILLAIVLPTLLWADLTNRNVLLALFATIALGAIGFLDDWLHVVRGVRGGLLGRWKLLGQALVGATVAGVLIAFPAESVPATWTTVPFFKFNYVNFGILFIPFVMLVISGSSNAVNLTDGLDGLASGLVAFAAVAFAGLCYVSGNVKFSQYLSVLYLPGSGELTVFCAAVLGASLGFLWFNCHPADVFMGDTGSLALGGALGTVAVLIKREFLLFVIGGVFVAEALSVMLQVASFKLRGKRIFLMSPLHHHFELKGWAESRVVTRFYIAAAILALVSLSTLKLQ
jgi:phospho-N-acetylmuramoyl-pentapeptide-transferase